MSQSDDKYVVLLGDSVIDNQSHVSKKEDCVMEQLKNKIENVNRNNVSKWKCINCAVEGSVIDQVINDQIDDITFQRMKNDIDCIVVSVGGNDALLKLMGLLDWRHNKYVWLPWNFINFFIQLRNEFRDSYNQLLNKIYNECQQNKSKIQVICCTIYYPIFDEFPFIIQLLTDFGVNMIDNIIINCVEKFNKDNNNHNVCIIDLRFVNDHKRDYISGIEPSKFSADKLTNNIIHILTNTDNNKGHIYKLSNYSHDVDNNKIDHFPLHRNLFNVRINPYIYCQSMSIMLSFFILLSMWFISNYGIF